MRWLGGLITRVVDMGSPSNSLNCNAERLLHLIALERPGGGNRALGVDPADRAIVANDHEIQADATFAAGQPEAHLAHDGADLPGGALELELLELFELVPAVEHLTLPADLAVEVLRWLDGPRRRNQPLPAQPHAAQVLLRPATTGRGATHARFSQSCRASSLAPLASLEAPRTVSPPGVRR